jgi:3-oxoacyl-[acyl-carrier protein] reductase
MSENEFAGRVALVSGASGGIGAALSLRLARAGAAVAVHYASNRDAAQRILEAIESGGGRAAGFAADLGDPDAPERLVDSVEGELGPVDLLAANAGLARRAPYEEVDAAAFDELAARVPVGRLGTPAEVADLALAVLRNGYLTNQVIAIDGGIHPG